MEARIRQYEREVEEAKNHHLKNNIVEKRQLIAKHKSVKTFKRFGDLAQKHNNVLFSTKREVVQNYLDATFLFYK